ncbi:MAG TPA: leucyl/phenylalanyl-tRNA--protein transferase [Chthoniobacterales bacterium]|jgi:leucyl/phenylalanyl-tRNA--protein transferase
MKTRSFFLVIEPDILLRGYRLGIFPMAMPNDEIGWFSPDPRTILPLDHFHIPHGLRRERRKQNFEIRINHSFAEVMRACAARDETWINREIRESYVRLHEIGCAHSVEAWLPNELVGGLYGVAIGGAFFGESMFHRATGASKIALWALVERLRARGFTLLDLQWLTPHLAQFGAREIPRPLYLHLLNGAVDLPRTFA